MRYTIKKLEQLIEYVNVCGVRPVYNGVKGRYAVNSAYGAHRVVNVLPCGGWAEVSGMTRGSARKCAMQLMECLRIDDEVSVRTYLRISDFFNRQIM